jgi:hypothetical protein
MSKFSISLANIEEHVKHQNERKKKASKEDRVADFD